MRLSALKTVIAGTVAAVAALLGLTGPARAVVDVCSLIPGNLVTNCGFETGDFTGWTATPASGVGTSFGVNSVNPHSGAHAAFFRSVVPTVDSISQAIPTVAGATYSVTFWLSNDLAINIFDATFGGSTLLSFTNRPPFPYTMFTENVVANSTSTPLVFEGAGTTDTLFLDDISVVLTAPPSVPEPASLALLGGALLAFGIVRRRKTI